MLGVLCMGSHTINKLYERSSFHSCCRVCAFATATCCVLHKGLMLTPMFGTALSLVLASYQTVSSSRGTTVSTPEFDSSLRKMASWATRRNYAFPSGRLIYSYAFLALSVQCYQVPMQVPMHAGESQQLPHADVAVVEIMRVMKAMIQWLGSHDLARFFVEDVDESRIKGYRTVSRWELGADRRLSKQLRSLIVCFIRHSLCSRSSQIIILPFAI